MPAPLRPPPAFRGAWHAGSEAHALAGRVSGPFRSRARAFASPVDAEDLGVLVRHAADLGVPLVPRGAGTGMPGGNVGPGIVVSLAEGFQRMGGVRRLEAVPDRRSGPSAPGAFIRVEAGVVAARVDDRAREAGLRFPPLPSSARWATVGGMAATQAAGARSFGRGATGAWVHEVEGVDARGAFFRLGPGTTLPLPLVPLLEGGEGGAPLLPALLDRWPRVRKNSSGYGVDRWQETGNPAELLVGSEGTLGIVTALTLRLEPRPALEGVCLLPVRDAVEAGILAREAPGTGAVACEFLGRRLLEMAGLQRDPELGPLARDAFALFLLAFEGESAEEVEAGLEAGHALGRRLSGEGIGSRDPSAVQALWSLRHRASPLISDRAKEGLISTQFIEDSVVPPALLGDYLVGLDRILAEAGREMDAVVFGHAGDGNVHVNPLVPVDAPGWEARVRAVLEGVVELVASLGGTLAGEHGDGRLRAPFLDRIWGPELSRLFRAMKGAMDPEGILNPGVVVPLPGQDPLEALHPRPRDWPT